MRKYPIGAEYTPESVDFRIWAPDHKKAVIVLEGGDEPLFYKIQAEKNGYFSLKIPALKTGTRYWIQLEDQWLADPASRFQPLGPLGPSMIVEPSFSWEDEKWKGVDIKNQIIYEMHLGTFTQEGTFKAAFNQLEELADLGVTILELMPLNEFPGHFGWGYDGTHIFAPYHLYGSPDDVKRFINKAHKLGLGVILDVVYNHFGPEGNQIVHFSKDYFDSKHITEWGEAINFDNPACREFFLTNARYWIEEYHFDGLRIDATPWFFCSTPTHILAELTRTIKRAGGARKTITIGENETQNSNLLRSYKDKGYGFSALWNDDFHHTAHVRLTGEREAYYTDYLGTAQEFVSSLKYGFLYQGQYYDWQKKPRGVAYFHMPPECMVIFLENHDQIANSGQGKTLHQLSDPGSFKALTALLLLSPNTPMLFQGQEFASQSPFFYFSDLSPHLSVLVEKGRKKSLAQFPRLATWEVRQKLQSPADPLTFTKSKINFKERQENAPIYQLHKDLIKLRKGDAVFKQMQEYEYDGAVLNPDAFLIRYFGKKEDRLLIINFGPDYILNPAPEPLLATEPNQQWEVLWSSEATEYGGKGTPPINTPHLKILGHSAIILKSVPKK